MRTVDGAAFILVAVAILGLAYTAPALAQQPTLPAEDREEARVKTEPCPTCASSRSAHNDRTATLYWSISRPLPLPVDIIISEPQHDGSVGQATVRRVSLASACELAAILDRCSPDGVIAGSSPG